MSLSKPFTPKPCTNIRDAEKGVYKNKIPGLAVEVDTFGTPLNFILQDTVRDASVVTEKRDRFEKRNAFCNTVAEAGAFEWAIARCPSIDGKRIAKCSFCGAMHNWCVFYRRATDGTFLGWSGVDCFSEVVHNLGLPAADAIAEAAHKAHSRAEKFIKTMEKINDFKRDFPGLYEHRERLNSYANPYARLWHETLARIDSAKGVDEEWLAACERGDFDRVYARRVYGYHRRLHNDQSARRIPAFLKWASKSISEGLTIDGLIEKLVAKHAAETAPKPAAPAPVQAPAAPVVVATPAPVADTSVRLPNDEEVKQAKDLLATGDFDWSTIVKLVADGKVEVGASTRARLKSWHEKLSYKC